jgi:TPR repeat protein
MNNLANLGVKEDPRTAQLLYERSVDAGNPCAMVNLGVLHEQRGDHDTARLSVERAAELGDHQAKSILRRWRLIPRLRR